MDITRLEQDQMIEKYILKQMSDEEASEFEAYYLSNQECLDQLEIAEKLYQGLLLVAAEKPGIISEGYVDQHATNNSSWWNKSLPLWSCAAMFCLMVLSIKLIPLSSNKLALPGNAIEVVNIPVSIQRGLQQSEVLTVENNQKQIILSFYIDTEVEALAFPTYQFVLAKGRASSKQLAIDNITMGYDSTLYISLGTGYLDVGEYEFTLSGKRYDHSTALIRAGKIRVR